MIINKKLQIDKTMKIASFDVDAQKTFTELCPAELPVPEGHLIVDELNGQSAISDFRLGSKDSHPHNAMHIASPEFPQFSEIKNQPNMDIRWNKHGTAGSYGFELLDGLPHPSKYDFFVWKGCEPDMHPYGACYHDSSEKLSTGVIEFIKINKIKLVIVGGLATDYCVKLTVMQLLRADIQVAVNLGACRGISTDTVKQAIEEIDKSKSFIITSFKEIERV